MLSNGKRNRSINKNQMTESERVRSWLIEKRIPNKELVVKLGLSPGAISSIVTGRNRMSIETFIRLLIAYPDLCANWLLLGDNHQRCCPYMTDEKFEMVNKKDEEIAALKKYVELQQDLIDLMKKVSRQ